MCNKLIVYIVSLNICMSDRTITDRNVITINESKIKKCYSLPFKIINLFCILVIILISMKTNPFD